MNDRTEALLAETESRIAKNAMGINRIYDAYDYYEDLGYAIRNESLFFIDGLQEAIEAIYKLYQNHIDNEYFVKAYELYSQFDVKFFSGDELEEMAELCERYKGIPAFDDFHRILIENGVYEYLD